MNIQKLLNNTFLHKIAIILLSIVFISLFFQSTRMAFRVNGNDFSTYFMSSIALLNGENPYDTGSVFPYIYPLTLAFLIIPITALPYKLAALLWFIVLATSLVGAMHLIYKILGYKDSCLINKNHKSILMLIIFVIMFSPIQNNFLNFQINFILLFFCTAFYYYLTNEKPYISAIYLSLAISIKLVPGILLLFLLFKKEYKVFFYTILFVLVAFISPILLTGDKIFDYYVYYINNFIISELIQQHSNMLYFNISDAMKINFNISVSISRFISFLLVLSYLLYMERFIKIEKQSVLCFVKFSIYLLLILLLSPKSQTHHLIYMLPSIALMLFFQIYKNDNLSSYFSYILFFIIVLLLGAKIDKSGPYHFLSIMLSVVYLTNILILYKNKRLGEK